MDKLGFGPILALLLVQVIVSGGQETLVTKEKVPTAAGTNPKSPPTSFWEWVKLRPEQDDPDFVQYVRDTYLHPADPSLPYNLRNKTGNGKQNPKASTDPFKIKSILDQIKGGTFLEASARDGETFSQTLSLEKEAGWTGLLVEPNEKTYVRLEGKHRKATTAQVCLSRSEVPVVLRTRKFVDNGDKQKWQKGWGRPERRKGFGWNKNFPRKRFQGPGTTADCIPVYTLLLAYGNTEIDFVKLEVDGKELDVLESIPFDKVTFKVLVISDEGIPSTYKRGIRAKTGGQRLKEFMESKGYLVHTTTKYDIVFIHPDMEKLIGSEEKVSAI